jgi:hypothetical protein
MHSYTSILIENRNIGSIGISNKTSNIDTCSTSTYTCSTRFKPVDVINLTSWYNQTDVGTTIVPIEKNHGSMANIKSSFSSNIPKWKS